MIRITRLADYGIVVLTRLARNPEGILNARDLAEQTHLPLPMVSKVLKALVHGGLLRSQRGSQGGYSLAKPPAETTVYEMIRSLEGPVALTDCIGGTGAECGLEALCPVRENWHTINTAVKEALEKISLDDMTHPLRRGVEV